MTEHIHWKKLTNPDFLGAYAFDRGEEKTATIKDVRQDKVTGADGKEEMCTIVYFAEDLKPLILNRTNAKMITKLYHTGYIDEWVGKRITMCVKNVRAFGEVVEAVRIKNEIPRAASTAPILCEDCGTAISAVGTYSAADIARINKNRFGKALCAECSKKRQDGKGKAVRTEAAKAATDQESPDQNSTTPTEPDNNEPNVSDLLNAALNDD